MIHRVPDYRNAQQVGSARELKARLDTLRAGDAVSVVAFVSPRRYFS
jgi:enoyl-CoA hydratase/carnithine racemase